MVIYLTDRPSSALLDLPSSSPMHQLKARVKFSLFLKIQRFIQRVQSNDAQNFTT